MNIIELVREQLGDKLTGPAASVTGLGTHEARNSVDLSIPTILAVILGSASSQRGKSALGSLLRDQEQDSTASLASTSGDPQSMISSGQQMLSSLLGDTQVAGLGREFGRFTGLTQGAGKSLLGLVAPAVIGVLGREQRRNNLGVDGLVNMLGSQQANIANALPSGLAGALRPMGVLDGFFDGAHAATDVGTPHRRVETGRTTARVHPRESHRGRNVGLAIAALAAIGLAAWALTRDRGTVTEQDQQVALAPDAADNADASLSVGGVDVGEQFASITDRLSTTLQGIDDGPSAEAALPSLNELDGELDSVSGLLDRLPAPARSAFSSFARGRLGGVGAEIDRIGSLPDVPQTVKDTAASIYAKLQQMAA